MVAHKITTNTKDFLFFSCIFLATKHAKIHTKSLSSTKTSSKSNPINPKKIHQIHKKKNDPRNLKQTNTHRGKKPRSERQRGLNGSFPHSLSNQTQQQVTTYLKKNSHLVQFCNPTPTQIQPKYLSKSYHFCV